MGSPSLSALHKLQEVETHLRSLQGRLRRKERQLDNHRLRIKQLEEELASKVQETKNRQAATAQLELDFKAHDSVISKLRLQLNAAKNNKEYSAILTQLNTERADNSKLEERIIEELGVVDELKQAQSALREQIAGQESQLRQHESEVESERSDIQGQLDELNAQRKEVAQSVPNDQLAIFQRIADRHDGEAMAKVLCETGDVYVCEGCYMSVTMETVNSLMTRDDLQLCNTCGRILFLEQHEVKNGKE